MRLATRKLLDRAFSGLGLIAILFMAAAVLVILVPILARGSGAYVFRGTVEHRLMLLEKFGKGDRDAVEAEVRMARKARRPLYEMLERFESELEAMSFSERRRYRDALAEFKEHLGELLGPIPGEPEPVLPRDQYGETRWDRAKQTLHLLLNREDWVPAADGGLMTKVETPRAAEFAGTVLQPAFAYLPEHVDEMLRPRLTLFGEFLTLPSLDAHFFGGIWPEVLGTIYLTVGAMLFALPFGIVAAIYFAEYAGEGRLVSLLRSCVSTLAGVPSIVFGLFGLAFFINAIHVSESKSVLAGSLTLGLLVLPTIIRAAEEAIRAVPHTYKEAAMGLGAGRWHTVATVILPAALPGILTGIVISMGRAAGETAPIIFTAAVSVGKALQPWQALSQPTPALSWNIYNLSTEHESVEEIRHVQFGMVATLVVVVLLLNFSAILLRARVSKKLKG